MRYCRINSIITAGRDRRKGELLDGGEFYHFMMKELIYQVVQNLFLISVPVDRAGGFQYNGTDV